MNTWTDPFEHAQHAQYVRMERARYGHGTTPYVAQPGRSWWRRLLQLVGR